MRPLGPPSTSPVIDVEPIRTHPVASRPTNADKVPHTSSVSQAPASQNGAGPGVSSFAGGMPAYYFAEGVPHVSAASRTSECG